jgi:ribosome-associated translation inhibitor RaiA
VQELSILQDKSQAVTYATTKEVPMPFEIRGHQVAIHPTLRDRVEEIVRNALARFVSRTRRVTVSFWDINGPRGGVDKRCRIDVAMTNGQLLSVEDYDVELVPAAGKAVARMRRTIVRSLQRMRV